MARGNDPDAARELKERYGTSGNAQELIDANRARRDPLVATASRLSVDEEASAKLNLDDVDAPGRVLDAKVRGNYLSYVWEDDQGRTHRGAEVRKGLSKAQRETAEADAGEDPAEVAVAKAHAQRDAELAQIRADYEARIEDAVAKARADASKQAAKAAEKVASKGD